MEDVNASIPGVIICECDVVASSSEAGCPRRSPEISVNFVTELLSWYGRSLIFDRLPSQFCVLAGLADDRGSIVDQFDFSNGIVADKIADCVRGNVSEASVERMNVDLFDCVGTCCRE